MRGAQPIQRRREEDMMKNWMPRRLCTLGLAVLLGVPIAAAQDAPPVRVRGTIERIDGPNLVVKSRDGSDLTVVLADNTRVVAIGKASLSDTKPGPFVGINGMPQPAARQR